MRGKITGNIKKVCAVGMGALMMGATAMGAMALDLKDYPSPFVVDGKYDTSNTIVVGSIAAASDTLGAVDIATNLQYESKECKRISGIGQVEGGIIEDVPLGQNIAGANQIDNVLDNNDIELLEQGTINFKSKDYDYSELIAFGRKDNNVTLQTSLSSSDDDYQRDIAMEFERDSVRYIYSFDESIDISQVTSNNPLEISVLGKKMKIIDSTDSSITAYVGGEYFLDVDDSVDVNGKTITLKNVGSAGAIVVDVNGVSETISASSTKTINGIEITNDETFYDQSKSDRSATLIIGKDSLETFGDGDAYVGEDEDNPDWIWHIDNLDTVGTTSVISTDTNGWVESGPILSVRNDFVYNDDSDNPPMVGECIEMPNNYVSVCLDSFTVSDDDYVEYVIEYDNSADLSDVNTAWTSKPSIFIHTNKDEGLKVFKSGDMTSVDSKDNAKTEKIWLTVDSSRVYVVYEDNNNKEIAIGYFNGALADDQFANINYEDTKDDNFVFALDGSLGIANNLVLDMDITGDTSSDLKKDNIYLVLNHASNGDFRGFGLSVDNDEADELQWGPNRKSIGSKDEDMRTLYGVIIKDPSSTLAGDEVRLVVPGDQVEGRVSVYGGDLQKTNSTESSGNQVCSVSEITPVTKLDTEITGSESSYNLILVGGPCANKAVEAVAGLGITCEGWDLKEGEGILKLAKNGEKIAMLVAGTNSINTRQVAKVISHYTDYKLKGTEMLVRGTSLQDITVEGSDNSQTA